MARGGGASLSSATGILDQLRTLIAYYQQLTEYFHQIAAYGQEEVMLIDQADMDALLAILKKKETMMEEAACCQERINTVQAYLAEQFHLESFSVKNILQKAHDNPLIVAYLHKLQHVINDLISQLEVLEAQERQHEQLLHDYAEHLQTLHQSQKPTSVSGAKKAYQKRLKPPTHDIDIKR